jgi:rRNA processing protein Gar1
MGPIDHPYLLVRPFGEKNKNQLQIIGEKLYTIPENKSKKRRK